MPIIIIDKIVI